MNKVITHNLEKEDIRRDNIVKEAFKYRDTLLKYTYVIVKNREHAEDVLQNAFVVIVKKYKDYKEGTSFFAWIKTIVYYQAMYKIQQLKKEIPIEEKKLLEIVSKTVNVYVNEKWHDTQQIRSKALENCMLKLSKISFDILNNFYWERNSCEIIAKEQKKTIRSIQNQIFRARKWLKKCISSKMKADEVNV